ncbi:MAG TPA: DUF1926 domain-containing protein, partial [Proteobacteria bacterium]|nr:DUF1926 domain-containing protein [Pseudomonadota bacterium]
RADRIASARYRFSVEAGDKKVAVLLSASLDGSVMHKSYEFFDDGLVCRYRLQGSAWRGFFSTELNFNLLAPRSHDRYIEVVGRSIEPRYAASRGVERGVDAVRVVDEQRGFAIAISLSDAATFYRYPVETVSNSESGLERTYQCTSLVFLWSSGLLEGGLEITVKIERLKDG